MKIALIGQNFEKSSGQGVYEFSSYLYEHLKKINKDIEVIKVGNSKNSFMTLFNNTFVSFYKTLKNKSNVYHFMMPEIAFSCLFKRPSIVTIHDLIPLIINERKKSFNLYFRLIMKIVIKADHLIAVSNSTKKDLIKILKIPEKKISVIHEGVNHKKFYPLEKKRKNLFTIGYLGGLGKRKNIDYILRVAKEFGNNKGILFKIAGKGPELNKLIRLKKKMDLKNVEFVGFVQDGEMNNFYNSLDLFIFPSRYEGFGLPIVEAMACGIPIITSNISSLAEIAEDTGILINPKKPKDAVRKIKKIVKNLGLQKKLRIKSIKKAKEFKWDKTAKETFKIYEKFRQK
tara:strand:- start:816 stop:1844 length:1029 start_codon:yes stop_codon:yes gene_type:complete